MQRGSWAATSLGLLGFEDQMAFREVKCWRVGSEAPRERTMFTAEIADSMMLNGCRTGPSFPPLTVSAQVESAPPFVLARNCH